MKRFICFSLILFVFTSCFKEIDIKPLESIVGITFTVQHSIQKTQTYYALSGEEAVEVDTASPRSWDLAFESAGDGSRVMIGWSNVGSKVYKTGKNSISEISVNDVLDYLGNDGWTFDDPAYSNYLDSISLQSWEDGEVYFQNRGLEKDKYYLIQFVEKTDDSYTFNYAQITTSIQEVQSYTIDRSDDVNFVYFSFDDNEVVTVEPPTIEWDLVFTPYSGWWETLTPGEYAPYGISGILINNEGGVRIAQIFNDSIEFEDIDETYIATSEFTDWKGAIGSNWKLLGDQTSENIFNMDPKKKYILKKFDSKEGVFNYFKLRVVSYKFIDEDDSHPLIGEDHYPTVEFKLLAIEN